MSDEVVANTTPERTETVVSVQSWLEVKSNPDDVLLELGN
jgi:hypothetical protein